MGRMGRYEDEFPIEDNKPLRIDKNQELYADVYLNNVFFDVNSIEDVIKKELDEDRDIKVFSNRDEENNYIYEEKNYDIRQIIKDAIGNKKDDGTNISLIDDVYAEEINTIVESISVTRKNDDNKDDDILTDLMPTEENTELIPALTEPILESSVMDNDNIEITKEYKTEEMVAQDFTDDDYGENPNNKKRIVIIVVVVFVLIIIGVILWIVFGR